MAKMRIAHTAWDMEDHDSLPKVRWSMSNDVGTCVTGGMAETYS